MNRIIKFRAWDTRNKRMICWNDLLSSKELLQSFFGNEHYATNPPRYFYERMQFTGLLDCEGKEVFEGDILRWTSWEGIEIGIIEGIYIVQWNDEGSFVLHGPFEDSDWPINDTEFENIIGNLYEHPNLLNNES